MTDLTTPLPYRSVGDTEFRNRYEVEMWADLAAVVYRAPAGASSPTGTLTHNSAWSAALLSSPIPCPVACRLEIHAHARLDWSGGNQQTGVVPFVDGTQADDCFIADMIQNPGGVYHMASFASADVAPGTHLVTLRCYVGSGGPDVAYSRLALLVRRGRRPSGT